MSLSVGLNRSVFDLGEKSKSINIGCNRGPGIDMKNLLILARVGCVGWLL